MNRLNPKPASFAHRFNDDETFDSICHSCFQTVAQSAHEPDLQSVENLHVCNPSIVEHYRELSKAVSDYREERSDVSEGILNRSGN
jgi:hypothetical protein